MSYLAATALTEYRLRKSGSSLDKQENRNSGYGVVQLALNDTPNLINASELTNARTGASRATKVVVMKKLAHTSGSTRTCTGATMTSESALVTVSWTTWTGGFHMLPAQYVNNDVAYVEDFMHKMGSMERDILTDLDGAGYTKLNTVKSTVNAADGNPFAFTSNEIIVPSADQHTYLGELYQTMYQNDFTGPFNVIGSPALIAANNFYSNQGQANATNTVYQFGDYNFFYSNRVSLTTDMRATFFVMPNGSLALLTWVDQDSKMRSRVNEGNYWDVASLPQAGFDIGLHYQKACFDGSTEVASGSEATMAEYFNFSFDYAYLTPYNSDSSTLAGPIYKGSIVAA
jgi:hypothetical protein